MKCTCDDGDSVVTRHATCHSTLGLRWASVAYAQHLLDGLCMHCHLLIWTLVIRPAVVSHSLGICLICQEFAIETDFGREFERI